MSILSFLLVLIHFARAVDNPFRVEVRDATVAPGGTTQVEVTVVVPPGFHVYRDMMDVVPVGAGKFTIGEESFPPGLMKDDPASPGQKREQYESDVVIDVPVTAPKDAKGTQDVSLLVRYQGCKKNLCYMPGEDAVTAKVTVVPQKGEAELPALIPTAQAADPAEETAVVFTGKAGEPGKATIGVDLQGEWHINKAFVSVSLPDPGAYTLGEAVLPPGEKSGSEADGSAREDFTKDFDIVVPVSGPAGETKLKVEVAYQACKGAQLCRMPTSEVVEVPVVLGGATEAASAAPAEKAPAGDVPAAGKAKVAPPSDASGFAAAAAQGTAALVFFCFLAGIGVSFTPCVLPMVPITMGLIGAKGAGSRAQAIALSGTYTLGMAAVYTALGVFAGVTGALFGSWLQNVWVVGGIAAFFFVMGFAMFGYFDVGIPSSIASKLSGRGGGGGFGGALVLGVIGAILAGPCSGPVVAAILALIGQGGQVGLGAALMFAFSLGIGMIFLVTSAASGWLPSRGPWMVVVKKGFGIIMWLGAIYYVAPHLSTTVTALLTAAVLLTTAVFSWPAVEDGEGETLQRARQLYSIAGGLVGAYLLVGTLVHEGFILPPLQVSSAGAAATQQGPKIDWLATESDGLAKAQAEGKPLMIDFTAEWCAACHEMEKFTYTDARVIAAADGFVPVMIDCTERADPAILEVQKKYGVTGLPTVVFVRPDGTKVGETVGYVEAEAFLGHMEAAKGS